MPTGNIIIQLRHIKQLSHLAKLFHELWQVWLTITLTIACAEFLLGLRKTRANLALPSFKGSMTHLQALQISMDYFFSKWLLTSEEYCESFRTHNLSVLIEETKLKPRLYFLFLLKASVQMLLEEKFNFVNQMVHYSNNFIICNHKLSFHITIWITLFLFKTPTMFCKCIILPLHFQFILLAN